MVVAPFDGRRVLLWAGTAGEEIAGNGEEGQGAGANVGEENTCCRKQNRSLRLEGSLSP